MQIAKYTHWRLGSLLYRIDANHRHSVARDNTITQIPAKTIHHVDSVHPRNNNCLCWIKAPQQRNMHCRIKINVTLFKLTCHRIMCPSIKINFIFLNWPVTVEGHVTWHLSVGYILGCLLQLEDLEVHTATLVRHDEVGVNGTLGTTCLLTATHKHQSTVTSQQHLSQKNGSVGHLGQTTSSVPYK